MKDVHSSSEQIRLLQPFSESKELSLDSLFVNPFFRYFPKRNIDLTFFENNES